MWLLPQRRNLSALNKNTRVRQKKQYNRPTEVQAFCYGGCVKKCGWVKDGHIWCCGTDCLNQRQARRIVTEQTQRWFVAQDGIVRSVLIEIEVDGKAGVDVGLMMAAASNHVNRCGWPFEVTMTTGVSTRRTRH